MVRALIIICWVAGMVLLVLGLLDVRSPVDVVTDRNSFLSVFFRVDKAPVRLLTVGTVLVGVAGLLTAERALAGRRR